MNPKVIEKINNGREYRAMQMEASTESTTVEGYATTFNQPYRLYAVDGVDVYEQVAPTAFEETDMNDVIMQYDHAGRVFARLSNGTLHLTTDEHGLRVSADLGGTEIGRQLYEEIKGGYTNKMSFGFTVTDAVVEEFDRGYIRTINRIGKLYDVSAVSLPANDYTEISAKRNIDGAINELVAERIEAEKREDERRKARGELAERIRKLRETTNE